MFCSNCGKMIDDGLKFCPECGTSIADMAVEAAGAAETVVRNEAGEVAEAVSAEVQETAAEVQETAAEVQTEVKAEAEEIRNEAEIIHDDAVKNISEEAEAAEREAQRVEEEAKAAIADAQAKADAAKAKAEAAMAEAREKARKAAMAKAEAEASAAVKQANRKIQIADVVKKNYDGAMGEARTAYANAQKALADAESAGVTGLPALLPLTEEVTRASGKEAKAQDKKGAAASTVQAPVAAPAVQTGETKLLRPWAYFLLTILYCIPVIGWIFLIVHTFGNKNKNRKYFALSVWIWVLVTLIIGIIGAVLYLIFKDSAFVTKLEALFVSIYELIKGFFTAA
ncbi:MAG: zinc-ribbon domain-containing protein [Clostridia bacterium]|nr:zinc-ribbon domain-containing protein [Clostridia bacterium]